MITDSERAVLNEIYKNSKVGLQSIHNVMSKVYDNDLALDLNRQAAKYSGIEEKVTNQIKKKGIKAEDLGVVERAKMWTSTQVSTALNTSTEHVAQMMIHGNAQGITNLLKAIKHNPAASKDSCELAEELMNFEEKNIRILKSYLKNKKPS